MKTLKFQLNQKEDIVRGRQNITWLFFDDQRLDVGDIIQLINNQTNRSFGYGCIEEITIKRLDRLSSNEIATLKLPTNMTERLILFNQLYNQPVTSQAIIKIIKFTFSKLQPTENAAISTTSIKDVNLYTDGGSRGNPGAAACAFAMFDEKNNLITTKGLYLGVTTNNQAEYQGLLLGIKEAKKMDVAIVKVYMDSLLVINQMLGIYKIKDPKLMIIYQAIKELINDFNKVTFTHVPRAMNKLADEKVNEILDSQTVKS